MAAPPNIPLHRLGQRKTTAADDNLPEPPPSHRRLSPGPSQFPRYIQFLFIAGLTALFILLAVSMQRNHFLDGALDHRPQHVADDDQAK